MSSPETSQLPNYYEILGADPLAQLDQIEALFRQLAIEAETSGDHSKVPQAVEAFKVLRDPQLRQQYDQLIIQQQTSTGLPQTAPALPAHADAATPQQAPVASEVVPSETPQPTVQPTVQPAAQEAYAVAAAVTPEPDEPGAPEHTPENKSTPTEELKFKPDVLDRHRRELLKMFYEKRRKNMRSSGMAIGGLDSLVPYSYELLEFHLWVLSEKKWVTREESGALSISALGCENHEKNLGAGLIDTDL